MSEDLFGSGSVGPFADAGDDPAEVLRVAVDFHLMAPVLLRPLQVVQPAIQVHDVGLLADDPLVEVGEDVRTVAAVLRRAHDDGLAREPRGDPGGIPQADRIADEDDLRQPCPGGWLGLAVARGARRQETNDG